MVAMQKILRKKEIIHFIFKLLMFPCNIYAWCKVYSSHTNPILKLTQILWELRMFYWNGKGLRVQITAFSPWKNICKKRWLFLTSVAEFSVPICSTPKFICSSDDGVPGLLFTESDIFDIKVSFTKTGWCECYISLK